MSPTPARTSEMTTENTTPMTETQAAIMELMTQYEANRVAWVDEYGTADGFDEWFTKQVMG
jgi:hypothetical protein